MEVVVSSGVAAALVDCCEAKTGSLVPKAMFVQTGAVGWVVATQALHVVVHEFVSEFGPARYMPKWHGGGCAGGGVTQKHRPNTLAFGKVLAS